MWPGQFMGLSRYFGVVKLHAREHIFGVVAQVAGHFPEVGAHHCGV